MSSPVISVIVPTCNRMEDLSRCLERLAANNQSLASGDYEVIVTNDRSDGDSIKMLTNRFPWVHFTDGPGRGPAANRNHGAELARAEWLVFIDDDCLPSSEILAVYHDAAKRPSKPLGAFQGPTLRLEEPSSLLWEAPHNPRGEGFISANFAIRKIDFYEVGRFDERFPHAAFEDTEFFDRLLKMGGSIDFVPAAIVHHPLRPLRTAQGLARRWEGKVIQAFDQGASSAVIAWRLPWHVARVIQSRFRGKDRNWDNARAATVFLCEWIYVTVYTPSWIWKWSRREPSRFWAEKVLKSGPMTKYGF